MKITDALYVISVAARLVDLHPTTLRKYERVGFLEPSRTPGRTRLYSLGDIRRLRQIKRLVEEREMNLAGVQMALELTERLRDVQRALEQADNVQAAREGVATLLRQAFEAVGASEETESNRRPDASAPVGVRVTWSTTRTGGR